MKCTVRDLEGMGSNPVQVEHGVCSTSPWVFTWTKSITSSFMWQWLLKSVHIITVQSYAILVFHISIGKDVAWILIFIYERLASYKLLHLLEETSYQMNT